MALKLEKCTEADMYRFFEIASLAFAHNHPYFDAEYPKHDEPSGRAAGAERMAELFRTDKHANFLKVVDDNAGGEMIAAAKWNVYDGEIPPFEEEDGKWWETDEEREYAHHMTKVYLVQRRKKFEEVQGRVLSLEFLHVDPKYQRRGAGRMLVKWGVEVADRMGVDAVIESSAEGAGLYKQEGFTQLDEYDLPLPDKWKDRPKQRVRWMEKMAKPVSNPL